MEKQLGVEGAVRVDARTLAIVGSVKCVRTSQSVVDQARRSNIV